jgi:palmitoyl-protein thioesterase
MLLLGSLLLLSTCLPSLCSPPSQHPLGKPKRPTSLPVVLWHGLGDSYDSEGMAKIASLINETYPGTFIHSIFLDDDPSKDRNAGFLGHVADQVYPENVWLILD